MKLDEDWHSTSLLTSVNYLSPFALNLPSGLYRGLLRVMKTGTMREAGTRSPQATRSPSTMTKWTTSPKVQQPPPRPFHEARTRAGIPLDRSPLYRARTPVLRRWTSTILEMFQMPLQLPSEDRRCQRPWRLMCLWNPPWSLQLRNGRNQPNEGGDGGQVQFCVLCALFLQRTGRCGVPDCGKRRLHLRPG
jgi:hypothetical protein